jgi:hypothetical protein
MGAGLTALAPVANAATADITGLTITPASATGSTGEDVCQQYVIDVTESGNNTDGTLTVKLQPTGGIDSWFCGGDAPVGSTNSNPTNGGADYADFVIGGDNQVTIGVNDANGTGGAQGQIAITAFPQNTTTPTQPAAGAPTASATYNLLTADAQNDVVTALSVDPTSASGTEGDTVTYTVTAKNGSSSVVQDAAIYYTVKSSQNNSVGQDNQFCGYTDYLGQVDCNVTVPATTSVQSGPYTVTFKAPQNAAGEHNTSGNIPPSNAGPTTTATLSSIAQAANNSTLSLTCGSASTNRYDDDYCSNPRSARSESITATVLNPPAAGATTGTPEPGVQVHFYIPNNSTGTPTLDPETCVTDAQGTCSTTVTRDPTDNGSSSWLYVDAYIATPGGQVNSDNWAYKEFGVGFESPATNIAADPKSQSAAAGTTQTVSFKVTNQYGIPANETCFTDEYDYAAAQNSSCDSNAGTSGTMSPNIPVSVTITGVGTFSDGTTTKTVTASGGTAQVAVTSNAAGTSTITGSLDPSLTDCTVPAGSDPASSGENDYFYDDENAKAGNCSDQATVTWTKSPPPPGTRHQHPDLSCNSPKPHVLKCHLISHPRVSGVEVKFKKVHKDGTIGKTLAIKTTDASGEAKFKKKHIKSGKVMRIIAHVAKSSGVKGGYSNVDKTTIR